MLKSIVGSITTIGTGGLHWLVDLKPEIEMLSLIVSVVVGILTAVYIFKKILEKGKK